MNDQGEHKENGVVLSKVIEKLRKQGEKGEEVTFVATNLGKMSSEDRCNEGSVIWDTIQDTIKKRLGLGGRIKEELSLLTNCMNLMVLEGSQSSVDN